MKSQLISLAHNTCGGDLNPIVQIREMPCVMDFPRRYPSDCDVKETKYTLAVLLIHFLFITYYNVYVTDPFHHTHIANGSFSCVINSSILAL